MTFETVVAKDRLNVFDEIDLLRNHGRKLLGRRLDGCAKNENEAEAQASHHVSLPQVAGNQIGTLLVEEVFR